jgi:hypothetical protein
LEFWCEIYEKSGYVQLLNPKCKWKKGIKISVVFFNEKFVLCFYLFQQKASTLFKLLNFTFFYPKLARNGFALEDWKLSASKIIHNLL